MRRFLPIGGILLALGCAPAAHAPREQPARLPFQTSNHLILLSTHVRSDSGLFVLDTGASTTVIDEAWAATLGLRPDSTTSASATGGTVDVGVLPPTRLSVGPIEWIDPAPALVSLDGLSASLGTRVRGIIGAAFFRRFVVQLDYSARAITVFDSTAAVKL